MKILLGMLFVASIAGAQTGTPTMLLLAPDGERLARFMPEVGNYRDSVITSMHGVSAIRFNDYDTSFYVVMSGDSAGKHGGILRFGVSKVQQQQITALDTMLFADSSAPSEMVFFSPTKAYVCLRNKSRIQTVNPHASSGDAFNFISVPGRPRGIERMSLSRTIVACAGTTDADSSHIVLINTDVDSVIGSIAVSGVAQWCVLDPRFKLHVLSRHGSDHAVITVVDRTLHIDTSYVIAGDYSAISATSAIDSNYERIILSNGSHDSLASQYNPLTGEVFKRLGPRGILTVGTGTGMMAIGPSSIMSYAVGLGGSIVNTGLAIIPFASSYPASLDVSLVSLGVDEKPSLSSAALSATGSPQPCSSEIEIRVSGGVNAQLCVVDCVGRSVITSNARGQSNWRIDTSLLVPGEYFAMIRDGARQCALPFTVLR